MGVLKLAAIAAVGIALLPSDREKQTELYNRAATAAKWTITFCDRNEETCTQASNVWAQFAKKAEFGAKLAIDVMRDNNTATPGETDPLTPAVVSQPAGTLTDHDLRPQWRGKVSDKKGI